MKRGHNIDAIAVEGRKVSAAVRADQADRRARKLAPLIRDLQASGLSLSAIARELTAQGIPTPRGKAWSSMGVARLLARISPTTGRSVSGGG